MLSERVFRPAGMTSARLLTDRAVIPWRARGYEQSGDGGLAAAQSPVFSDAEDNTIGGDLKVTGLQTCWIGALRNHVRGDLCTARNAMADPDADEVLANVVRGDIACFGNTPATQYGDSASSPNQVRGHASGECAFSVRQPDPSPSGPLTPISVKT